MKNKNKNRKGNKKEKTQKISSTTATICVAGCPMESHAATVLTPFAFFEAPRTTNAEIQNYTNKPLQWGKKTRYQTKNCYFES